MKKTILLLLTILIVAMSASAQVLVYQLYDENGNPETKRGTISWDGTKYIHTLDKVRAINCNTNPTDGATNAIVAQYTRGIKGDVNGDGEVNVADVSKVVDAIMSDTSIMECDVNGDFAVNISDINVIINIILNPQEDNYEYVDLGLPSGTLWATCNVGASSPEEYGDYFAWGETEPKDVYDWTTYKWCNGSANTLTKYCTSDDYGTYDGKWELDPEDDAAYVNWGPSWRMPTEQQQSELMNVCTWNKTWKNGVIGYKVTGPNGNALFLPAAGCHSGTELEYEQSSGGYWRRTLFGNEASVVMYFYRANKPYEAWSYRYKGWTVRAVRVQHLLIEQENYDFGEVPIGQTHTCELTIINNTAERQTMTVIADEPFLLEQENSSASSITVSVPGNSRSSVTVLFTATTPGEYNGNVTFQCPAIDGGQRVIPVQAFAYSGDIPEHRFVDLGLPSGTLWATCNIGASSPEEYGDYFAWGETEPKEVYSKGSYKWYNIIDNLLIKYCISNDSGMVDNMTELYPEDDAAYVNWGSEWSMPTHDQMWELSRYCTKIWTTRNGVEGTLCIGPNGNMIFLPAAGFRSYSSLKDGGTSGRYWSRTLNYNDNAWAYCFDAMYKNNYTRSRSLGHSVRAVRRSSDENLKRLYVVQNNYDFGDVPIGETRSGELTIINYSMEDVTVAITADEPFLLEQENSNVSSITVSVPSNSRSSITLTFTATDAGICNGDVTFQCPAMEGGQITIPVQAATYTDEAPQYVDLGLPSGTLWARCNIGASTPEEYGDLFAWGETEPKDVYDWTTYKWCNGSQNTLTKYCTNSLYGIVDGKTVLDPEDDAAYVNLGSEWRMPTERQQFELHRQCSWVWATCNGVNGYRVTGPNGNTLFLPIKGIRADFWSCECSNYYATGQSFDYNGVYTLSGVRCRGLAVRAVRLSRNN